jgi:predicted metal-binding protein
MEYYEATWNMIFSPTCPGNGKGEIRMAKKIGIIYCKRIQDQSCVGCAKCYKAVNDKAFVFEGKDDPQIVFKTGCGDCPGLVLPKLQLQMAILESLGEKLDEIYFGTCVKKATGVMNCPMNIDAITHKIEDMFKVPVVIGTHEY